MTTKENQIGLMTNEVANEYVLPIASKLCSSFRRLLKNVEYRHICISPRFCTPKRHF